MGEVSILEFKKAQVFCIKNSSCVKTGKSLRAIATWLEKYINFVSGKLKCVKTGKSLRAIATIKNKEISAIQNPRFCFV